MESNVPTEKLFLQIIQELTEVRIHDWPVPGRVAWISQRLAQEKLSKPKGMGAGDVVSPYPVVINS